MSKPRKKPELLEQLQVGNYIDVYHANGKSYRLAYILNRNDREVEITYDGIAKKENETIKLTSNKLYFARRHSQSNISLNKKKKDYTGDDYRGAKTSRDYLKYNQEECLKKINQLKEIIQTNWAGLSPLDITQIIRVRQFIWLDMVLSIEVNPQLVTISLEYIKTWLQFIVWYLQYFPQYYSDVFKNQILFKYFQYIKAQQNLELYLVDEKAAIALCYTEIIEGLCMITGSIWRVLKLENSFFYINFEQVQQQIDKVFKVPVNQVFTTQPNLADWKLYQGSNDLQKCIKKCWNFYLRIASYFKSIKGFEIWDGLLQQTEGEVNYLPLKAFNRYCLATQYMNSLFQQQDQALNAKKILDWCQMRANTLTTQDIKDSDIDTIKDALNDQEYLFQKHFTSQEQLSRFQDDIQLQLAVKFLKSTFLEKRVKGISEIKEMTEKFKNDLNQTFKQRQSVTKEELVKWIREQKIIDLTLLGDSVHPELIKRTNEVAIFLCKNNAFQNDLIEKIWLSNQDKHETTQLAIYEFFKSISPHLNYEGIEKLYVHIANIPYNKYNENIVSMIKTFSEAALSSKFHQQQLQQQGERRFFTFNILWELLQDREDQQVSSQIQDLCFQAARQIVSNNQQTKAFLNLYFSKCFELIRDHKSVYQAISFVHYILDKQFRDDGNGKRQLIRSTNDKYSIIELFVKDVEVYMEKVRQYFKDQIPTDIIISGVQNYQQNVFFRLQMLNYLLSIQELKISYDQIVRLYDTLCVKTKGGIQKREFNKIILYNQSDFGSNNVSRTYFPDKDMEFRFFNQILCNADFCDYENYTQEDFELFLVFFKSFNTYRQSLKFYQQQTQNKFVVLDHSQIEGKQALWNIFQKVKDPRLVDTISKQLITLYTNFCDKMITKVEKIHQELMDKCLEFIQLSCPSLTQRSINLIINLFNIFQVGPIVKKPFKSNGYVQFKAQIIYPESKTPTIQEYKEQDQITIHLWRQKLAEELQVAYKQIDIYCDGKYVENSYDITETQVNQIYLAYTQVRVIVNKKYHPRNYLSQNSHTFDLLFKLLSKQDSVEFSIQVWDLLNKLPINQEVSSKVENCTNWKEYIDKTFYEWFYVLQIIKGFLDKNPTWSQQFILSDGKGLVLQRFLGQKLDFILNPLEKKCILTYLEIFTHNKMGFHTFDVQFKKEIQNKIINILDSLAEDIKHNQNHKRNKENNEVESKLVKLSFQLLDDGVTQFIKNQGLPKYLEIFFLDHDNNELKREFQQKLGPQSKAKSDVQIVLKTIFDSVLNNLITQNKQKCEQIFDLICDLIQADYQEKLIKFDAEQNLRNIQNYLHDLESAEVTNKDVDHILVGLLKVLNALLQKYPHLQEKQELFNEILSFVLEENGEHKCKCKSSASRSVAFECLLTLLNNNQNLDKFRKQVAPLHSTTIWRTKAFGDWNIQSKFHEKSNTGYVGLYNLGCICYMNSLLQQLFMLQSFREPLISVEDKYEGLQDENLIYQLKCLFQALKYSQKQYHNPKKFCHAFKDLDGNPTNIFDQMDVDEFYNLLMDRIEAQLKGTSQEDLVKRNFGGIISHEVLGKNCPHYSENQETFYAISLPVTNKKTFEECLQTLIIGDTLEGDNAYFCEQCQKKVNAQKRMCLKKLPNHLIFVLKRFDFDFDLMAKAKINDRIEFPFDINLLPFCQQGLRIQENRQLDGEEQPNEYFQYRLSGIVIHMGSADSGHYYSFIQDKKDLNKWYEFNDVVISNIEVKDIINDAFGGAEKQYKSSKYTPQFKDKSKSAYMLFYERVKPINDYQQIEVEVQYSQFYDEIKDENRKYQIQRFIFSQEYFNFFQKLLKAQLQQLDHGVVRMIVYFFLTCAVREYDRTFIMNNILDILTLIRRSYPTAEWILQCFSQPQYIKEFQLECTKKMIRKFVLSIIEAAFKTIQDKENSQNLFQVENDQPKSLQVALINAWIYQIPEVKKSMKNATEFFDIFYRFASLSKEHVQYLNSKRIVGRLFDFYFDTQNSKQQRIINEEFTRVDDLRLWKPLPEDDYLGSLNQAAVDLASNYYDDILEKKLEKSINFGVTQSKVYLWRSLAYVLKQTDIKKLTTDEQQLLTFETSTVLGLLEEGDCKLSIRMIADILAVLTTDNQKMTDIIIQAILKQIADKEYKEYRKYLVVLKRLFQIKDSIQVQRITASFNQLFMIMQKQSQYFFETDICQQYILKILSKNQIALQVFQKNQKFANWMIEISTSQQAPQEKLLQNNQQPQKCLHRLHNIQMPLTTQAYIKYLAWKKQQFILIQKDNYAIVDRGYDSDDDFTGKELKVDDKIDFYSNEQNDWINATVIKVMADYVQLKFSSKVQPQIQEIEVDCERLGPLNAYSTKTGNQNNEVQVERHQSDNEIDTEEGNYQSGQSESEDQ